MSCSVATCSDFENYDGDICRHVSGTSVASHRGVGKAQLLLAYTVSDETVPDKTEVCNFFSKVDANKTAVIGSLW